jgi:hypothetical protein
MQFLKLVYNRKFLVVGIVKPRVFIVQEHHDANIMLHVADKTFMLIFIDTLHKIDYHKKILFISKYNC